MNLFDWDGLVMCVHFQDQLLQVQEGLLVSSSLSDLNNTLPVVLGLNSLTLIADLVHDLKLDHACLLQNSTAHVLLARDLDLDTLRVRLGPDEARIDQVQLVHALDALETQGEELTRLECCLHPCGRRLEVAFALAAELKQALLGQLFGDVDLGLNALHACVQRVLVDQHTALTAQTKIIRE